MGYTIKLVACDCAKFHTQSHPCRASDVDLYIRARRRMNTILVIKLQWIYNSLEYNSVTDLLPIDRSTNA